MTAIPVGLHETSAADAAAAIRDGDLTSEALVQACLDRISAREEAVQAWTFLDHEYAVGQARAADGARAAGRPLGPLHGVPVGIKDIFDTADMPTENGSVLHAGRQPTRDSTPVALLREAGAVIMGKAVTTEFAFYQPGKTHNPHDPARTPGGSSSGSAAAVAAGMVPLALGSQTNGSVIRPASFCGVYGYKPTHGAISRTGVLILSRVLDHIGVFARTVEDVALLAEVLMAYDPEDPDMRPRAGPVLRTALTGGPPTAPRLAFVKTPMWRLSTRDTRTAFAGLARSLGQSVEEVSLPAIFDESVAVHATLVEADIAVNLAAEYARGRRRMGPLLRDMIANGQRCRVPAYMRAIEMRERLNAALAPIFEQFDAILTPAAPGIAPRGLGSTGNPVFCTIWTLCGTPALTVPILEGAGGMPIGAQLVCPRGDDARLIRLGRWLAESVSKAGRTGRRAA